MLRNNTHLVVFAAHRRLLALGALLEMKERRVILEGVLEGVLGPTQGHAVLYLLVLLMEVGLRLPQALLIGEVLFLVVALAMRDLVVWVPVLLIALDKLAVVVDLGDVAMYLINEHTGEICFYQ